ncbi:C20orf204 isoform 4, partial [Pan troglodytes]
KNLTRPGSSGRRGRPRASCGAQKRSRRPKMRPARRRGGRRQLLLRALDAVATCWEKLFALRAPASRDS